ncbi:MAG: UDP-N-acetylmuramate--L-alanine ligase [Armatimonadetes bacterium]|nr:UDP-N-acetylmuramate--L-alanine ligase [Armatimonadota bacterium]
MRIKAEIEEWFSADAVLPAEGRVHFIGIGGAGMSALARILLEKGREVSGSDLQESALTESLRRLGADVQIGHDPKHLSGASAVIISDAIDLRVNPEALEARKAGLPLLRRSQLLSELIRGRKVIAVTGSHGKSTTTAFVSHILREAGLDPLAVVGAEVREFGGSVLLGKGEWAVVEACEAYDSLHDLRPDIVLLTNLEPEHLDYHKSWAGLRDSMVRFVGPANLVYCAEDAGASEVAERSGAGIGYGFESPPLDARFSGGELQTINGPLRLSIPGRHNALNALGAVAASALAGVSEEDALRYVAGAPACRRRLERIDEKEGTVVIDDYAHHPTEIRATIKAVRESFPDRRLIAVFQPHLYTRTRDLLEDFAPAFSEAEFIFMTDIYPAREEPIPGVSASLIVENLEKSNKPVNYVSSRHLLPREVAAAVGPGDVVVSMGAGNIDAFPLLLLQELERKKAPLRVMVFCGGDSPEREVSRVGGGEVARALSARGYGVRTFDPSEALLGVASVAELTGLERPDVVFIVMHGTPAEDGTVQGFLELLRIPYTGSGIAASALAIDKNGTKRLVSEHGIAVPRGVLVRHGDALPDVPFPAIVKPNGQGSTIGLSVAGDRQSLKRAVAKALKYDSAVLIEEFIEGTEISVPVLGDRALPAVEICPLSGRYDFAAKYTPGATEEIVPARISGSAAEKAAEYALKAHRLLGLSDFSRSDMIVRAEEVIFLEVNTIPGLTPTSLVPKSAESDGISFEDLCETVLESALKRYGVTKAKA